MRCSRARSTSPCTPPRTCRASCRPAWRSWACPSAPTAQDALCGAASLDALAEGAVVGTASVRRRAELLALRPDLEVRELRGNVDTRLRRLGEGGFDAIVLAAAGLERLGRSAEGAPLPELVPAPGQGCLALEARAGDERAAAVAAELTDRVALTALTAERALVTLLGATCNTPIGAHAVVRRRRAAARGVRGTAGRLPLDPRRARRARRRAGGARARRGGAAGGGRGARAAGRGGARGRARTRRTLAR